MTKCKAAAGGAVILMVAGTYGQSTELRAWALLFGVLTVAFCIHDGVEDVQAYIKKWSHETYQSGFRSGVDIGREMEAAERFIAATREKG